MGSMQVCIWEGGGLFHLVHAVADCIDEQGDHKGEKKATATRFHHEFFSLTQYFPLCG